VKKHLFIALATTLALASCQKETPEPTPEPQPITFTAAFEEDTTKTTVTVDLQKRTGKVEWVIGDEVTITRTSDNKQGVYYVSSVGDKRKATLTYKSGTQFTTSGTYTAQYGDVNNQWYDSAHPGSNCPMTAAATTVEGAGAFMFSNQCGVLAITANTGDNKIAKIIAGDYSLNFASPQQMTSSTAYLIAIGGSYKFKDLTFVKADGSSHKTSSTSDISIPVNTINTLKTGDYFKNAKYSGFTPIALPGEFSVSANKKVHFSRGNLQYQASTGTWRFAENQYDYIGNNPGNTTTSTQRATQTSWIDLFGWGATGCNQYNQMPYSSSETSSDYKTQATAATSETLTIENGADWGYCIGGVNSGWYTLSKDEWTYLIDSRDSKLIKYGVTVANKPNCTILAPDNYTGTISASYEAADWATAEANGLVCLPASGYRTGNRLNSTEFRGSYWSSSASNNVSAYNSALQSGWHSTSNSVSRTQGLSVRLVYYKQ